MLCYIFLLQVVCRTWSWSLPSTSLNTLYVYMCNLTGTHKHTWRTCMCICVQVAYSTCLLTMKWCNRRVTSPIDAMRSCDGSFYRNVTLQVFVSLNYCNKAICFEWCQSYKHLRNINGGHTAIVKDRIYIPGKENGDTSRNGKTSHASRPFFF
jgi:hypothetical protein